MSSAEALRRHAVTLNAGRENADPAACLAFADAATRLYADTNDTVHWSSRWLEPLAWASLAESGAFPRAELGAMAAAGPTAEGPLRIGLDVSSGSAGEGLSVVIGRLLAESGGKGRALCVMDDREMEEGQVWEAAMSAAHFGLGRLIVVLNACGDDRPLASSPERAAGGRPDASEKFRSFRWSVDDVDGHDADAVAAALSRAGAGDAPTVVICRTRRGHGASSLDGAGPGVFSEEDADRALGELGTDLAAWRAEIGASATVA